MTAVRFPMKLAGALTVLLLAAASITLFRSESPPPHVEAEAWPVVRGSIGGDPVLWFVAFKDAAGVQLCRLEVADAPPCQRLDGLSLAALRVMPLATWAKGSTFWLAERLEGTVPEEALKYSRFVDALLVGSRGHEEGRSFEPAASAAVEQFRLPEHSNADEELALGLKVRAWAVEHRHDDALFAAFTRHRAIGECSADTTPQRTTQLFAELAFARGDLPTFLDLQIQLMADSFERAAWSSFAHAHQPSSSQRLLETGVDLDQLFLGLLIQHPATHATLDDWRLAKAIREAGRAAALLPRLESLATLSSLDPYNRFRATEVWLHLQVYDEPTAKNLPAVRARASHLSLTALSRLRVEAEELE